MPWTQLQAASDNDLIAHLISGNDDAFAVIVDRYQRLVFSVALRILKDEGEAEDLVQTVFADVFKKVGQFDPARGTLKVWLLQYAYNRSINRRHYLEYRQFYSQLEMDDAISAVGTIGASRNVGLSPAEMSYLVTQALHSLNPKQQTAIALICFQGLTLEEAAEKSGETLPALRHNYYRGLMKLRDFIGSNKALAEADRKEAKKLSLEVGHLKPRTI